MKSILMSIQPKYCKLIASGKKTIEVRKTAPKEVPFRAFIYCTYGRGKGASALYFDAYGNVSRKANGVKWINGKVIGEFICDYVEKEAVAFTEMGNLGRLYHCRLSLAELKKYAGKRTSLYYWHISALKVYDKPKELWEFRKPDTSCGFYNPDLERCDSGYNCERCVYNDLTITRPPQSWQYIGEIEE